MCDWSSRRVASAWRSGAEPDLAFGIHTSAPTDKDGTLGRSSDPRSELRAPCSVSSAPQILVCVMICTEHADAGCCDHRGQAILVVSGACAHSTADLWGSSLGLEFFRTAQVVCQLFIESVVVTALQGLIAP